MAEPIDPYANGGAENNIERQKGLLNDLIAQTGQQGRQLYERQGPDAMAMLNHQLQTSPATPDSRKAVYDQFVNDAKMAEQSNAQGMQRQAALNAQFLDQAKAAVPIHAADVKNQQEALRMQFEDAKAERAARAASSGGGSRKLTVEERIAAGLDDAAVKNGITATLLKDIPKSEWTASDAKKAGLAGAKGSYMEAASELGLPPGFGVNMGSEQKSALGELQGWIDSLYDKDYSFSQVVNEIKSEFDAGTYSGWNDIGKTVLQANARRWGIRDPAEWGASSGQSYRP